MKHFRVYLSAREFTIRTDHHALKWLLEREPEESVLGRWITDLQGYRFKIETVKGSKNQAADALSRLVDSAEIVSPLVEDQNDPDFPEDLRAFLRPVKRDWATVQQSDPILNKLRDAVQSEAKPEDDSDLVRYLVEWDRLELVDEVLVLKGENLLVVVPESEAQPLAVELHSLVHSSSDRTLGLAETRFWWPKMRRDIERATLECEACDLDRRPNPSPNALQERLPVMAPFEMVFIDIVGGARRAQRPGPQQIHSVDHRQFYGLGRGGANARPDRRDSI